MKKYILLIIAAFLLTSGVALYAQPSSVDISSTTLDQSNTANNEQFLAQDAARLTRIRDQVGQMTQHHTEKIDQASDKITDANDKLLETVSFFRSVNQRFIR